MNGQLLLAVGTATLLAFGCAHQQQIADSAMGLSKTAVEDTPAPEVFAYPARDPGGTLPRAYAGAPPQVPHQVDSYLPITATTNMCLGCHDQPNSMGTKTKGAPTPMSESHYVKVEGKWTPSNGRHACFLCHTPQASVNALVGNTFKPE